MIKYLKKVTSKINSDRSELFRLKTTDAHIQRWGASWFRAGILAVNDSGEYLCVEEKRAKINGVYQDVSDIWNLPSGCSERHEDIVATACREGKEETGYTFQPSGICQIIHSSDPLNPYIMIVFVAQAIGGEHDFDHSEIKAHRWLSREQISILNNQNKLRSPGFILGAISNYESGLIMPLDILRLKS